MILERQSDADLEIAPLLADFINRQSLRRRAAQNSAGAEIES